jgi:hypothetical protein
LFKKCASCGCEIQDKYELCKKCYKAELLDIQREDEEEDSLTDEERAERFSGH